jgi:hypothetical protein
MGKNELHSVDPSGLIPFLAGLGNGLCIDRECRSPLPPPIPLLLMTPIPLAAPPDVSLKIIELGLLGIPLSLSGANLFCDQRTCHLINVTLYVCVGGLHLRGALILTRLRCAASNHYQNDESTQFGIRH